MFFYYALKVVCHDYFNKHLVLPLTVPLLWFFPFTLPLSVDKEGVSSHYSSFNNSMIVIYMYWVANVNLCVHLGENKMCHSLFSYATLTLALSCSNRSSGIKLRLAGWCCVNWQPCLMLCARQINKASILSPTSYFPEQEYNVCLCICGTRSIEIAVAHEIFLLIFFLLLQQLSREYSLMFFKGVAENTGTSFGV